MITLNDKYYQINQVKKAQMDKNNDILYQEWIKIMISLTSRMITLNDSLIKAQMDKNNDILYQEWIKIMISLTSRMITLNDSFK